METKGNSSPGSPPKVLAPGLQLVKQMLLYRILNIVKIQKMGVLCYRSSGSERIDAKEGHPLSETLKVAAASSQWWWCQGWWPYFRGMILMVFG